MAFHVLFAHARGRNHLFGILAKDEKETKNERSLIYVPMIPKPGGPDGCKALGCCGTRG
jgi:hypothetical protein